MNAVYLSGTGNTEHITGLLFKELGKEGRLVPIESEDVEDALSDEELIIAYPTQFSNIPYLIKDFIRKYSYAWKGKKIFLITTMGLFSGDGTGCAARLLKKVYLLHLISQDCSVRDSGFTIRLQAIRTSLRSIMPSAWDAGSAQITVRRGISA